LPSLAKLYNEFKSDGFSILAVDIQEPPAVVKKYANKEKLPFPVLLDLDGRVARRYGVKFQPDHYLINKKGELIGRAPGAKDWASKEIRNLIRFLVKQK